MWLLPWILSASAGTAPAVVQVDGSKADIGVYAQIDRDAERSSDVIPFAWRRGDGLARLACTTPCVFSRPAGEVVLVFRRDDPNPWQRLPFFARPVTLRSGATHLYIDAGDRGLVSAGTVLALTSTGPLFVGLIVAALVATNPIDDPEDDREMWGAAAVTTGTGAALLGLGIALHQAGRPRLRVLVRP